MTALEFRHRGRCVVCGRVLAGIALGSYRVNKSSLRATDNGLSFVEDPCRECGTEQGRSSVGVWWLTPESEAKVTAIRERKGWTR